VTSVIFGHVNRSCYLLTYLLPKVPITECRSEDHFMQLLEPAMNNISKYTAYVRDYCKKLITNIETHERQ